MADNARAAPAPRPQSQILGTEPDLPRAGFRNNNNVDASGNPAGWDNPTGVNNPATAGTVLPAVGAPADPALWNGAPAPAPAYQPGTTVLQPNAHTPGIMGPTEQGPVAQPWQAPDYSSLANYDKLLPEFKTGYYGPSSNAGGDGHGWQSGWDGTGTPTSQQMANAIKWAGQGQVDPNDPINKFLAPYQKISNFGYMYFDAPSAQHAAGIDLAGNPIDHTLDGSPWSRAGISKAQYQAQNPQEFMRGAGWQSMHPNDNPYQRNPSQWQPPPLPAPAPTAAPRPFQAGSNNSSYWNPVWPIPPEQTNLEQRRAANIAPQKTAPVIPASAILPNLTRGSRPQKA